MKKKLLLLIFSLLLISVHDGHSQVKTEYFPEKNGKKKIEKLPKDFENLKTRTLPNFDLNQILNEDRRGEQGIRPFRFGKGFDVNIEVQKEDWKKIDNGRVWAMEFKSKGAKSINFVLKDLNLIKGAELYAFNEDGTVVYGPVTHLNNTTKGVFLTDLIQGDHVTLYIHEPSHETKSSTLLIKRVVHGYKGFGEMTNGNPGASENCNNNIECFPAWDLHSDAVGLVLLSNGEEWCSGSLVMTADQSFRPYFLSAFHCIDRDSNGAIGAAERDDAENWMFKFQFKYTTCGGNTVSSSYTYNDATFKAGWFDTDFLLMELDNSPIGNNQVSWAGWDRSPNTPNSGTGIHHPAGDVMKISIENNLFQTSNWNGTNNHWLLTYDDGIVQHGSSGSPIFNQNNRIVGQLHGNQNYNRFQSYCNQPRAEYGRFNVSWTGGGTNATRLSNWLDPCGSGAVTTNTTRSPFIFGSDQICTSGSSFQINNLPPGATINWTSSFNITRNSSQGSNPSTFSSNGSGSGWIQATITLANNCANNIVVRKNVDVGPTMTLTTYGPDPSGLIYVSVSGGTPPYTWMLNTNSNIIKTGNQSFVEIYVECDGGYYIMVESTNSCGTGFAGQYLGTCGGNYNYSYYPNPASSQITIENNAFTKGQQTSLSFTEQKGFITIYNFNGAVVKTEEYNLNQASHTLDVSDLKIGKYFMKISAAGKEETHQIVIIR